jgi:hypothetical protein
MANPREPKKTTPPLRHDWAAAFLSYLVPGLGQIFQGRVGKGVLFLVCVYALFFYGMHLGSWQNVYLPRVSNPAVDANPDPRINRKYPDFTISLKGISIPISFTVPKPIAYRVPFLGQFWVGVVVWPAIYQHVFYHERIYRNETDQEGEPNPTADPVFGKFMRTPSEEESNVLQNTGDKTWDLGWVYTVIAGVLNVLVIYDALVGPAFIPGSPAPADDEEKSKKTGAKDAARR